MKEYLAKLDKTIEEYLVTKAPKLPKDVIKFLVAVSPWFAVLTAVLGIPAFLAIFGFGALMTPFAYVAGVHTGTYWFYWLLGLAQLILSALSIKPLFARVLKGWTFLFYAQLLALITSLGHVNLGSLLVTVISFYLLYQIKHSYK